MSMESLIESGIDKFQRKDLELAGWVALDVDQNARRPVNRPSILSQLFSTTIYAINPYGVARLSVRGCLFSEPQGRNRLECNVDLTLSLADSMRPSDRARVVVSNLIRLNANPAAAVEMLVKSAVARTQNTLKEETIYEFDSVVIPLFKNEIVSGLSGVGLKADASIEWDGYAGPEPQVLDGIVVPFRIPGVARRLETKLSCEI